jgi:hypothetical protein
MSLKKEDWSIKLKDEEKVTEEASKYFAQLGYHVDTCSRRKYYQNIPDLILNGTIAVEVKLASISNLQKGIGQCLYSLACGFEQAFFVTSEISVYQEVDVSKIRVIVPQIRFFIMTSTLKGEIIRKVNRSLKL